jgi:PAS domain S-box-containing protein
MTRPLKVLIIEDAQSDAELMVHELKQAGFQPKWTRADTETQYLAALGPDTDLILSDYSLPQFDAFLALQLMQERKLDVPFIVISGTITEEAAVEFMKQGASDYLIKDRMARLGQAAAKALEQKEQRLAKKKTEEALLESEALYSSVIGQAFDIIYLVDVNTKSIVLGNIAFQEILGLSSNDLSGLTLFDIIDKDKESIERNIDCIKTSGNCIICPEQYRRKDGSIIDVEASSNLIHYGKKEVLCVIARDITERKQMEKELSRKTADLVRSNQDLEQFAYIASHDLQEPLRTITRFVQLLQKRYHGKLDQDAEEFIDFIVGGTKRMQQLIDDLLTYSRVNTMKEPPRLMNSEDALKTAMQNLKYVLDEAKGTVRYEKMPSIVADERQMTQVFQNVIGNALKFHGKDAPQIEISAFMKENDWIFSVRDNGIGIDPKYKDRIFEIFQRLHAHDEYSGTGIGLAIAKKIVERHDGRIWVDSEPGAGSTFYFTIPAVPNKG